MNDPRDLVLDANIAIRGVFGTRVEELLRAYDGRVAFYTPDICIADARRRVVEIAARSRLDPALASMRLDRLEHMVQVVSFSKYQFLESPASDRIRARDISDWPIVATSLLLNAPLWTEDRDFFGCGIATWTTNTIEIYLRSA